MQLISLGRYHRGPGARARAQGPNWPLGTQGPHPAQTFPDHKPVSLRQSTMQQSTVQQSTMQLISLGRYHRGPRGQGPGPGTQLAPRDPGAPP